MKIGVTGGTGFIGKVFVSSVCGEHDLTVLTLEGESPVRFGSEEYVTSDFSREDMVQKFAGCDAIVHLAFARPAASGADSVGNYFESIAISENVFGAASDLGIKNVVTLSSRSVYSASMEMPLTEERAEPYSVYGAAKLTVEKIGGICNARGMKIKFLRCAQVMGVGERKNLMTVYFEKARGKETLPVYGEGASTKTYIYVKDVARAIMCALEHPDESGVFNIGMTHAVSNLELAKLYCEVFDNADNYVLLRDKKEDGEVWRLDVGKVQRRLGFSPAYDVRAALADMKRITEENEARDQ